MKDKVLLKNKLEQLNDIMVHVGYVMQSGHKLIAKLFVAGEDEKAMDLLERIMRHDYSKCTPDEFYGMAGFSDDVEAMKDPNVGQASYGKMEYIKLHWIRNSHHPEFWVNPVPETLTSETPLEIHESMGELDIMEMCCDWHARSSQFGTSPLDFYNVRGVKRWKFNEEQEKLILKYLSMLIEE